MIAAFKPAAFSPSKIKIPSAEKATMVSTTPRPASKKPNNLPCYVESPSKRIALSKTGQYTTSPNKDKSPQAIQIP